jgi:hypothetical protein
MAMGLLVVVAGIVLVSCDNSTGPSGGHQHQWGPTIWSETVWHYYNAGEGPLSADTTYRLATETEYGLGYAIGTKTGKRICELDKTTVDPDYHPTLTYDQAQPDEEFIRRSVYVGSGKKLRADGLEIPINEQGNDDDELTLPKYNNDLDAVDVDMLGVIDRWNDAGSEIHNSLNNGEAALTINDIFAQYADQAEKLRAVFAGASAGDDETLADTFTALQTAEGLIKTAGNGNTVGTRLGIIDARREDILKAVFGEKGTSDRNNFDKYFDAYTKGQYLITADWNTRTQGGGVNDNIAAAVESFKNARHPLASGGLIPPTAPGTCSTGRGIPVLNIGTPGSVNGQFTAMKAEMENQIIDALGLTGIENADKMAQALVIQLAQDQEEFRAFIDDITAEGLTGALGYISEFIAQTNSPSP